MSGKASTRAKSKYNIKTYDNIQFRALKSSRINERLDVASKRRKQSKAQYILDAVETRLTDDGITIESLPDQTE